VIVKMIVEKQMECRLAGETEVLGENLPQPATNRLSYGAAVVSLDKQSIINRVISKEVIIHFAQPYGPPRPVTGIDLPLPHPTQL
jgi:hypothetical protein